MDENDVKIRERVTKLEADLDNEIKEREKLADVIDDMRDIVSEIRHMRLDLNEITVKVNEIEAKPAKRWDLIVTGTISAAVSGILGFVISHFIG